MKYVYACARCGTRFELDQPATTIGPIFVCETCQADYGPTAPATLKDWATFLAQNPTARS